MKSSEIIRYSYVNLRHRQARFWLTVLGVIIGIAAVVSLLTIGAGFGRQVNEQLASLNGNTIYIFPISESALSSGGPSNALAPSAGKLTEKDAQRLKKIPEVEDISRLVERRASLQYKGKEITATVNGIEPDVFAKVSALEVAEGRFLQDSDRRAVGLGADAAAKAFGEENRIGVNSFLIINDVKFRVIGVLKKTGGGFGSDIDNGIFVHYEDSHELFRDTLDEDEMDAIALKVADDADLSSVVEEIRAELDASHRVKADERDYSVIDPQFISQSVGSVLGLVTLFLGAIASISLVVGGLAIATAMYTSVIERTQEIGVLKAVGAKDSDILSIFLFEAGALGGIGGIVGTSLGLFFVWVGSLFGLPAQFDLGIALFGVAFAVAVGLLSGYFPSRQAASLSPIEAFRYDS
jgi:putative ABC transport system permease protein